MSYYIVSSIKILEKFFQYFKILSDSVKKKKKKKSYTNITIIQSNK